MEDTRRILARFHSDKQFAQNWEEIKDGMNVKLVPYDGNGFIESPDDWIDCIAKTVKGKNKPELYDKDGCIWHDCLCHPYEVQINLA